MSKLSLKYKVFKSKGVWCAITIAVKPSQKHLYGEGTSPVEALADLINKEAKKEQDVINKIFASEGMYL